MKRIAGILMNIAAALSLLLCVAAAALWVRGHTVGDFYAWTWKRLDDRGYAYRAICLESGRGTLGVYTMSITAPAAAVRATGYVPPAGVRMTYEEARPPTGTARRWGLDTPRPHGQPGWTWRRGDVVISSVTQRSSSFSPATGVVFATSNTDRALALPCWMVVIGSALAPAWRAGRWARGRRNRLGPGQCATCGYDLRATADPSGPRLATCPECGRPADASANASTAALR